MAAKCRVCGINIYDIDGRRIGIETDEGNFCDEHTTMYSFLEIESAIKTSPYITEFDRLKNSGFHLNRVITCREDFRKIENPGFDETKKWFSVFIPGYVIQICTDGTWFLQSDGDN